ncbi:MAG TPA: hypothetical protein VHE35_24775, partial [Kofleriaceae bacterium]|nr:hypothetical protein [Kofleriaceae bacterium]
MRRRTRIAPGLATATAIEALFVDEIDEDGALVSIPHPQVQLVVRYGTMARGLVDVHAFGVRPRAHRKAIRAGQRAVTARLHVGASARVLGVPASALAGRTVPL